MTSDELKARIAKLRAEIARHDELYYRKAEPEISDIEYDRLKKALAEIEEDFPELNLAAEGESPTARVGDDRTEGFTVYRHRERMMSLDNTYSEAELREFVTRVGKLLGRESAELSFVVEPKIDGLAVSVTYEHGKLVRTVTRWQPVPLQSASNSLRSQSSAAVSTRSRAPNRVPG